MKISVVIPAHNPDHGRLVRTLEGLRAQTLPAHEWETLIVDNGSSPPVDLERLRSSGPSNLRLVQEPQLGLTPARLCGFRSTSGEIVVLVDDDNVLAPDYLATALSIAREHPRLGAWSGNVILEFAPDAVPPPREWRHALTERHVTADSISTDREHHDSTPWGAGLCARREACDAYADALARDPRRRALDLQGGTLLYGGDTDIAYVACSRGFSKGVFARLGLQHLIPAQRCTESSLLRSIEGHAYSAVVHGYILGDPLPAFYAAPGWRFRQWLRRLGLPRPQRLAAAARARGHARAVRALRASPAL